MSPAYLPKQRSDSSRHKRPRLSDIQKGPPPEDPNRRISSRKRNLKFGNLLENDLAILEASSEEESKVKIARPTGPKEYFKQLPKSHPFRMRHLQHCRSCGGDESRDKGKQLVFCQGCQNAYHHVCLGPRRGRDHLITRVAEEEYVLQCRFCIGLAHKKDQNCPHLGRCTQTTEMGPMSRPLRQSGVATMDDIVEGKEDKLYKKENVMFRCGKCNRAWQMSKLPPVAKKNEDADESSDEEEDDDESEEHLADKRYREYSRKQQCNECIRAPDPDTLAGWRPKNFENFDIETRCEEVAEIDKEYLVKWKKMSYYRATWMPGDWSWCVLPAAMRKAFLKKGRDAARTTEQAIPEDYVRVDIIFDVRYEDGLQKAKTYEDEMALAGLVKKAYVKYKGLKYEDTVWEAPPPPEEKERYQDFLRAYEDWVRGHYVHLPNSADTKRRIAEARASNFENDLSLKKQPASVTGGTMLDYQLDGTNWLYYMWYKQKNAILADEMGLGKTLQTIALISRLRDAHKCWPFLVVVPNTTVANWRREFEQWAPSLRVATYFGSAVARDIAREYQLFPGSASDLRCHVVITSYEATIDNHTRRMFSHIPWEGLVVDEAHRLKNDANLIYAALNSIKFPFRVLLTGTPLQNNIRELFNLLQFLDPTKKAEQLSENYSDLDKEKIEELHAMLRPCILRRTKETHLTFLPPMAAIILPVSMTVLQKKLYKNILAKNPALIKAIFNKTPGTKLSAAERSNLNNILAQLRKCLCHPFVYSRAIEDTSVTDRAAIHRNLTEASAKTKLLELLLPKLRERGHRVLLFSQFLENLDIIEDFLEGLGMMYCRIDGGYSSMEKQKQIDRFNAKDSPYFAFLLSTRAGGVGINLATADTVIILDPDFNPHQDMQALARAHRIGQQKKVLIFKLMTQSTVEEKIMQIGKRKMLLDHVLIERLDHKEDDDEDLEAILKHGATDVFQDGTENDIHYDNEAIERLLDRSTIETSNTKDDKNPKSQFSFARVWKNDSLDESLDTSESTARAEDVNVWDKILQERERAALEASKQREDLGRGKRTRQRVDYSAGTRTASFGKNSRIPSPELDEEFRPDLNARVQSSSSSEDEGSDVDFGELLSHQQKESRKSRGSMVPSITAAEASAGPKPPAPQPLQRIPTTGPQVAKAPGPVPSSLHSQAIASLGKTEESSNPATLVFQPPNVPKGKPGRPPAPQPQQQPHPQPQPQAKPQQPIPQPTPIIPVLIPPRPTVPELPPPANGGPPGTVHCPACAEDHVQGYCPLKLAGVERCNLCGQAHFGSGRTCPHFRTEQHLRALLAEIRKSNEDKALKKEATRYLRGVLGDVKAENSKPAKEGEGDDKKADVQPVDKPADKPAAA
ncbi:DNA-binding proteins Bright/BRCAA1/RBP1 and proteins containing BRIGHT domain [Ascosphaera pollenicola]|nr:DNA-binding proteins Bright/BRCAA1/RBP1 and proteins containing BRIGHT domain [Ascosphaera pollenicola]